MAESMESIANQQRIEAKKKAEEMDLFLRSAQAGMPPIRRSTSTSSEYSLAHSQLILSEYLQDINAPLKTQFTRLNKALNTFRHQVLKDNSDFNSLRREALVPNQSKTLDALIGSGYDKYSRGLSGGFSKKQLTKIILDKNKVIGDLEEEAYKGGRLRGYGYTHAENNFAYSHGISKYI